MCPLFAKDGSPWTGEFNATCPQKPALLDGQEETDASGCGFWDERRNSCDGCVGSRMQVDEVRTTGATLQIGPIRKQRDVKAATTFDCQRAGDCQWQRESGDQLCPPRYALSLGIDPKSCAW